jgi:hypothetical protein
MTLYANTQEAIRYAAGILRGGLAAFPHRDRLWLGGRRRQSIRPLHCF